ncbi:MAG: ArgE/DapE family deacylase [archaeon]
MSNDERVLGYVDSHRGEVIAFLQRLIRTESITGNEAKIARLVDEECRKDGLETELVEPEPNRISVVARYKGTAGKPRVMWYSHYDTLPPGDLREWAHPPFSADIADGQIWGRGASDNKSATCASIMAFRAVKTLGIKLRGDILFTHVCDEEKAGKYGFKNLIDKGYGEGIDYLFYPHGGAPDRIGIASNGGRKFAINVKGKAASTSNLEQGINAIYNASKLITQLQKLADEVNSRTYHLPGTDSIMRSRFSVNKCQAYVADNSVPHDCELRIDRRYTPSETPEMIQKEIQDVIDELKKSDPKFDAELSATPGMDVSVSSADSELVKSVQRCAKKLIGYEPKPVGGSHSSDHGFFNSRYHKPLASYGIGGVGIHAPNEHIGVEDIILTTKFHALLLLDLLGAT